eukprot:gene8547-7802_t
MRALSILCTGLGAGAQEQPLTFSAGFSDGEVLQRSNTIGTRVYGFAPSASPVTVSVTGTDGAGATVAYNATATVAPDGRDQWHPDTATEPPHGAYIWAATLQANAAPGGNFTVTVSDGTPNGTATKADLLGKYVAGLPHHAPSPVPFAPVATRVLDTRIVGIPNPCSRQAELEWQEMGRLKSQGLLDERAHGQD